MNFRPEDYPQDQKYENGNYDNYCISCGSVFRGLKHRHTCRMCVKASPWNFRRYADVVLALVVMFVLAVLVKDLHAAVATDSYAACGVYKRSYAPKRAFAAKTPCPSTGLYKTSCPGHVIDHIWPLCAGGKDVPENMQWQEKKASYVKDVQERALCAKICK